MLLLLLVSTGPSAKAHPFGPPLDATLTSDGAAVTVTWTGAEDDWMVVGEHTGAFAEVSEGTTGAEVLAGSPLVRDYLAERIRVSGSEGRRCDQEFVPVGDLVEEGARFAFHCPEGTTEVTVTLEVLTDVNAAYRTVLRTEVGDPGQTLFTAAEPTHQVRLDGSEGDPGHGPLMLAGGVGALVAAGAAVWALSRGTAGR